MDEPRVCHTEWSKSEREKQISYIKVYMWNLEKWYWWTNVQGSNRDADIEDGLVDTAGEGEGGTNWESSIDIYTMEYYSAMKGMHLSSNEVDGPRAYYTEWSKSEREKQILYVKAYIWNPLDF